MSFFAPLGSCLKNHRFECEVQSLLFAWRTNMGKTLHTQKKKFGPCSAPYGTSRAPKMFFFIIIIYSTKNLLRPRRFTELLGADQNFFPVESFTHISSPSFLPRSQKNKVKKDRF